MKALSLKQQKINKSMNGAMALMVVVLCFLYLNVSVIDIVTSTPQLVGFLAANFLSPNFTHWGIYLTAVIDTVLFAIIGTYISAILAFVLGVGMSDQLTPNPWIRNTIRFMVSFFRNIPVLIWASLLVYVFGIGNIVGLIALVFATIGFLSRSYAESINEIAGSKLESMKASGASWGQIVFHGLIPEFMPAWINWTLFSFEINIRASAILGMVGAGGLGILIQTNLNLRNFNEVSALVIILVMLVLATEFLVNLIRKHLR